MIANRAVRALAGAGILALGVGAAAVRAQEPAPEGDIAGAVVDADSGRPVPGARVRLDAVEPGDPTPPRRVQTDARGRYRFAGVPAGEWRLSVSALGYRDGEVWLDLPDAWRIRRSVGLSVAPVALAPVTVDVSRQALLDGGLSATGAAATGSLGAPKGRGLALDARVTRPESLDGLRSLGEPDVLRALQRLPGVSGQGDFAAQPWVRGAPWSMTHVLYDGLPLFDPMHLGGMTTAFAGEGLETATLHPGVQPMALARGASATLDVRTRPARENRRSGGLSSLGARVHAEDRWIDGRVGLSLTGRRSWWDLDDGVNYAFGDVSARADLRLDDIVSLEGGGLWEGDHLTGRVGDVVAPARGRWGNALGWGAVTGAFDHARVRAMVGHVGYGASAVPTPRPRHLGPDPDALLSPVDTRLTHTVVRVTAEGTLPGETAWSAGVESVRERLSQQGDDLSERRLPGEDAALTTRREAVWLESAMPVGPVDVAAGARAETAGPTLASLRVRWTPLPRLSLEAATGTSRQHTYPLAVAGSGLGPGLAVAHVWILAGDSLPSLDARTTTGAATARLTEALTVSVAIWRRTVTGLYLDGVSAVREGLLTQASPDGSPGRETGRGLEMALEGRWDRAHAHLAYSRGHSTFRGQDGLTWPSPAGRRHSFEAGAQVRFGAALRGSTALTVESGWPYVEGPASGCAGLEVECGAEGDGGPVEHSVRRSAPYASLDLALDWQRRTGPLTWGITASVRNLLGASNPAALRGSSCVGAELISSACDVAGAADRIAPGLTSPTPALAIRVVF